MVLQPEGVLEVEELLKDADEVALEAVQYKVVDTTSYQLVSEFLVDVKRALKLIEEERVKITRPQREALDKTNAFFTAAKHKYAQAEIYFKGQIETFLLSEKKREAAAVAAADSHSNLALAVQSTPVSQGVSSKAKRTWRVVDSTKIPGEFWVRTLNEAKVGQAARLNIPVPGIEYEEGFTIAVRTDRTQP